MQVLFLTEEDQERKKCYISTCHFLIINVYSFARIIIKFRFNPNFSAVKIAKIMSILVMSFLILSQDMLLLYIYVYKCFFAHLLILGKKKKDFHHNVISSSLQQPRPISKISSESVHSKHSTLNSKLCSGILH